jgi:hypothetical protein
MIFRDPERDESYPIKMSEMNREEIYHIYSLSLEFMKKIGDLNLLDSLT